MLDALWEMQYRLTPLLKCLPQEVWREEEGVFVSPTIVFDVFSILNHSDIRSPVSFDARVDEVGHGMSCLYGEFGGVAGRQLRFESVVCGQSSRVPLQVNSLTSWTAHARPESE